MRRRVQYLPINPVAVSPGTTVTVSVSLSKTFGSISADMSGASGDAQCETPALGSPGPIITGVCVIGSGQSPTALHDVADPPEGVLQRYCVGQGPKGPPFSPIHFSDVTINFSGRTAPLASAHPRGYEVTSGSTLQVRTTALSHGGKSFKEIFVHS